MSADRKSPGFSRSTEDYLKAIYELEAEGRPAQTSAIAEALSVAPPSVSGMVKRLSETGLLEHAPYRGVQLTPSGKRAALKMVRRHRVLETYLTTKLGYDWDTVHDEAERLEHAVSDQLIERMAMALGYPRFDPHGAPIPTKDGLMEEQDGLVSLAEVPVGSMAELRMVSDRDPGLLRFVASLGLRVGAVFEVVGHQPFKGPTTIRVVGPDAREKDAVVGQELAASLSCLVLEGEVG